MGGRARAILACALGASAVAYACLPDVTLPARTQVSACGDGFTPDGAGGCSAALPTCAAGTFAAPGETACRAPGVAEPPTCMTGQLATIGETACHDIADCGAAPWGAIPVDSSTVYVDASFAGASDGSSAKPFRTVQAAVDAAASGAIVAIAAGTYAESVVVSGKAIKLWGRCPSAVGIVSSGGNAALTFSGASAAKSEAHQIAVTGDGRGIAVLAGADTTIDRAWIHDTRDSGIWAGAATAITRSLVEGAHHDGVHAAAATVTLDASLVRGTRGDSAGSFGNGAHALSAATLAITHSVLEQNRDVAAYAESATIAIDHTVIRDTLPREGDMQLGAGAGARAFGSITIKASRVVRSHDFGVVVVDGDLSVDDALVGDTQPAADGTAGIGIQVGTSSPSANAKATIARTLVENSRKNGVFIDGAALDMSDSAVRGVDVQVSDQYGGTGISVVVGLTSKRRSSGNIRGVVVERARSVGVDVLTSDATIAGSVVRGVTSDPKGSFGFGVQATGGATLSIASSVVTDVVTAGIFADSSKLVVDATTVRGIGVDPTTGDSRGIAVQSRSGSGSLTLSRSAIVGAAEIGLALVGVVATVDHTLVSSTKAQGDTGGDGIEIWNGGTMDADHVRVDASSRGAIALFGGRCSLSAAALTCSAFSLDGERGADASDYEYALGQDVKCGCPGATGVCQVLSQSLTPPKPIATR